MASGAIRIFQTCQFFSPIDGPSMAHRWAVHGKAFLDPNFTHGVHGISVRDFTRTFQKLLFNFERLVCYIDFDLADVIIHVATVWVGRGVDKEMWL